MQLADTIRRRNSILHILGLGLAIGTAYYAGGAVGLALKLPNATPSVMWPPNAILTAALLLAPYRLWPFILVSALPAHILLETGAGWPASLVLALFATNCSEALIAAAGMRRFSDAPTRFDSLHRVGVFLIIVVAFAPFASSFLDAAAVAALLGEPYWQVFSARLFSNVLTALAVVPALVLVVTSGRKWLIRASRIRKLEAVLLAGGILAIGAFLMEPPLPEDTVTAFAERAPVICFLPFLIWAATRFGPGGASLALLASALLLVGAAVHSHGPFQGLSPSATTTVLQVMLIVVSLPLLVLAALIEERRLVQQDISDRLTFEELLAQLSSAFVHLPSNRMREVFTDSLRRIGEFLDLRSVALFEYSEGPGDVLPAATWAAQGESAISSLSALPHLQSGNGLLRDRAIDVRTVAPAAAPTASPEEHEQAPVLAIPLCIDDKALGALAFRVGQLDIPPTTLFLRLQSIARILAMALFRKRSEDALRASEAMNSAILTSLTTGVVVVDRRGRIITVNERWRRMLGENAPACATEVGEDFLEYFRSRSRFGEAWANEVSAGIEAVARGINGNFRLEYGSSSRSGESTYLCRAMPLDRHEGGAVVTHLDMSEQRRAEHEAQLARAELAHVSRVSTMGALAASIAHQLNQPLTGILANAQAVSRVLAAPAPELAEARAALDDIIDDNRRASEVIVRMRELLRKGSATITEFDLSMLVGDVTRLLSSDAIIRGVSLVLDCDDAAAVVRGDRIQLQQVILNLIVNALESFPSESASDRRVVVRCKRATAGTVEVSVIDNGAGFDGIEDRAFEAFYTTKQNGMGLGLSIAKSIISAHSGGIRANSNAEGGATVSFTLPLEYPA